MPDRTEAPDLLANLYGYYTTWCPRFGPGEVVSEPGLTLIDSGTQIPELNVGFLEAGPDPVGALTRALAFYRARGRPWRLEAPVELAARLDLVAREGGLTHSFQRPTLALRPSELRAAHAPAELRIATVDSADMTPSFLATLIEGMSDQPPPPQLPHVALPVPETVCYLGYVGGRPVATATLFTGAGIAGVYAVATIARERRQGYGRALTERALRDGFALGCGEGALQASEMGRPLYEAMGFRWRFDRADWTFEG